MIGLRRPYGFGFQRQSISILPWKAFAETARASTTGAHRDTHAYTQFESPRNSKGFALFSIVGVCAPRQTKPRPENHMHEERESTTTTTTHL
jgi:hypothetical protein